MTTFQIWIVDTFARATAVRTLMHTAWGWPIAESVHFLGLTLLIGTIGLFDLRLLGFARRIPLAAMHRLIRWGLFGFTMNVVTGSLFLMTEPDQYVYNPAFHIKVLFIMLAGVNALSFYLTSYRWIMRPGPSASEPLRMRLLGAISLSLWIGVIVSGRFLTFYRPVPCEGPQPVGLATCIPGYDAGVRD